jgi:hypothetical protein
MVETIRSISGASISMSKTSIPRRSGRVVGDGEAGGGDARRIGERQVALVAERLGGLDLQLAGLGIAVEEQRRLVEIGERGLGRAWVHREGFRIPGRATGPV